MLHNLFADSPTIYTIAFLVIGALVGLAIGALRREDLRCEIARLEALLIEMLDAEAEYWEGHDESDTENEAPLR